MKRFSPREFVLLCSPLVLVALVGLFLSRRKPPLPNQGKLRLEFQIQKPTTFEAFNGVDAALVVELKGPNTTFGPNVNPLRVLDSAPFLELQNSQGTTRSWWAYPSSNWRKVWMGNLNCTRLSINSRAIPPGKLRFGLNAVIAPTFSPLPPKLPRLSGLWTVNRRLIKPIDFASMARIPLVRLSAVKIIEVKPNAYVRGEAIFDLTGPSMNSQAPFNCTFKERYVGMGGGYSSSDLTPQTQTRRVRAWTVHNQFGLSPGQKKSSAYRVWSMPTNVGPSRSNSSPSISTKPKSAKP